MATLADELRADAALAQHHRKRLVTMPFNTFAVIVYRLGMRVHRAGYPGLALPFQWAILLVTGADIDMAARLGPGLYLHHTHGVVIGPEVTAAGDLTLYGGVTLGLREKSSRGWGYPRIGHNVEIFAKATVLGPVAVGDSAKIGAHALVLDDVPDGARVKGPPPAVVPSA